MRRPGLSTRCFLDCGKAAAQRRTPPRSRSPSGLTRTSSRSSKKTATAGRAGSTRLSSKPSRRLPEKRELQRVEPTTGAWSIFPGKPRPSSWRGETYRLARFASPACGVETSEARFQADRLEERGGWGSLHAETADAETPPPQPSPASGRGSAVPMMRDCGPHMRLPARHERNATARVLDATAGIGSWVGHTGSRSRVSFRPVSGIRDLMRVPLFEPVRTVVQAGAGPLR